MNTKSCSLKGLTLVELLIIVIILGLLAVIVIPRFNQAAAESKEAAICQNLATIRQAIELYRVQHGDTFPNKIFQQLEGETTKDGNYRIGGDTSARYGPYIKGSFPVNSVDDSAEVTIVSLMPDGPTTAGGWIYDTSSGEFRANTPGKGPSGTNYFDL